MKIALTLTLGLTLGLTTAPDLAAQAVQLRDGSILVGQIQDADGEGFTLRRTDNGGVLKLKWGNLTQSSARLIRTAEGLLNTEAAEVTVRADVISFVSSTGKLEEAVGRIAKQTDTEVHVRKRGAVTPIRRTDIRRLSERQVTPFEIFTKSEYYNDLLAAATPGEDADKHLELGERLMQVRDYEHAELHMKKAKELGGGRQSKVLEKRLIHLAVLKGAAAERRLLDEIRTSTNRGEFHVAGRKIAEFKHTYADSKLSGELARTELSYKKARERKLVRRTAKLWYKLVGVQANKKTSDPKCTLAVAKQYAETDMGQEIREKIAQSLDIQADEVQEFWDKRFAVSGASSSQHYYYSLGSWLLGPKGVLKDTKQGKAEDQEDASGKSDQEKKMQEGIKRIQEALKRARQARRRQTANRNKSGKKEVTPEDWWKAANRNAKTSWLKAYYAEFSGDLKMINAYVSPCPACGSVGRVSSEGSTGRVQLSDCPTCHRTRFKRDFRAK